jgi:hypothetical protein
MGERPLPIPGYEPEADPEDFEQQLMDEWDEKFYPHGGTGVIDLRDE